MNTEEHRVPRTNFDIESDKNRELSIQGCLENLGISLLSEWDVLAFVYRHGASLTSADQIARLIGYESEIVSSVLDRLEREKLIERSWPSQGVRFYRILASPGAERQRCLQQLVRVSESRTGRLLLAKLLNPSGRKRGEKNSRLTLEREGNWLWLKAV